jgi:Holliday junction resolvase RusA-like endonuclease
MPFAVHIEIPGQPISKITHRDAMPTFRYSPKHKKMVWMKRKYNAQYYEVQAIKEELKKQFPHEPFDEPLRVDYVFELQCPKAWSKKQKDLAYAGDLMHFRRPDVTNFVKFYEDCMTGVLYRDDCLIVTGTPLKIWAEKPRTRIWIRSFTADELKFRLKSLLDGVDPYDNE